MFKYDNWVRNGIFYALGTDFFVLPKADGFSSF